MCAYSSNQIHQKLFAANEVQRDKEKNKFDFSSRKKTSIQNCQNVQRRKTKLEYFINLQTIKIKLLREKRYNIYCYILLLNFFF